MPVLLKVTAKNKSDQFGGFIASDMMSSGNSPPEHGLIDYYKDNIWSRNDGAIPLTNFAAPWPAGPGRVPAFQGKHYEWSHASSEDTHLYPEDLPSDDHVGEYEKSESNVADGAEVEKIYQEYLAEGVENALEDMGVTIMLRDIPYKMRVEPHVFDLIKNTSDLNHVDYIYLPLTEPNHGSDGTRNKGYCFVHFSNKESAQLFVSRLEEYVFPASVFPASKMMKAGLAKFQGLSLNLHNVLDIHSKKWRPKKGYVYIRRAGGKLVPYGLLRLRNLLKARERSHTWKASGSAPLQRTGIAW
jgi:hypothetical protein